MKEKERAGEKSLLSVEMEEGDKVTIIVRIRDQAVSIEADALLICALDGDNMMASVVGSEEGLHNVFTAAIDMAAREEHLAPAVLCAILGAHRKGTHGADE